MEPLIHNLVSGILSGEEASLSRLISLVENGDFNIPELMSMISSRIGKAFRIGVTGPAGSGKSTLIDKLAVLMTNEGLTIGIIAVDPSSPMTGGAILGDRIRMQQNCLDDRVFIRSMATRGCCNGLSEAVPATVDLVDAFGKDIIIVETVGVGQVEVGIRKIVDVVILVLVPHTGDEIQWMKSGLTEIAHIIVANKVDLGGSERLVAELNRTLAFGSRKSKQTVISTEATNNRGIEELYQELKRRQSNHSNQPKLWCRNPGR